MSEARSSVWRPLPGAEWLLLAFAVGEWCALKFMDASHPPELLALLVVLVGVAFCLRLGWLGWRQWRYRFHWSNAMAEALLLIGILTTLSAGMVNWALGLQGAIILTEGESVRLSGGTDLQQFAAGPFARIEEMEVALTLQDLELVANDSATYFPLSRLLVIRGDQTHEIEVGRGRDAAMGSLRFFQGAFGFAPRIVIIHDGRPCFDRVVPFLSEISGGRAIAFRGHFTVVAEDLEVQGQVDLDSLDESMRGHVVLHVSILHAGETLGSGRLLPGHFADLDGGYRIGFAGLRQWSEINISRRTYTSAILIGTGISALGGLGWLAAAISAWLRRAR